MISCRDLNLLLFLQTFEFSKCLHYFLIFLIMIPNKYHNNKWMKCWFLHCGMPFGTNMIKITPVLVLFHIDPCFSNVYNLGCYFKFNSHLNTIYIWVVKSCTTLVLIHTWILSILFCVCHYASFTMNLNSNIKKLIRFTNFSFFFHMHGTKHFAKHNINKSWILFLLVFYINFTTTLAKCYHILNRFFLPKPSFLEFIWTFSGRNHLKINIPHIPNLTKYIPLNPAHQDLPTTFQFLQKFRLWFNLIFSEKLIQYSRTSTLQVQPPSNQANAPLLLKSFPKRPSYHCFSIAYICNLMGYLTSHITRAFSISHYKSI
jgi:hypothetical protein